MTYMAAQLISGSGLGLFCCPFPQGCEVSWVGKAVHIGETRLEVQKQALWGSRPRSGGQVQSSQLT